MIGEEKRAVFEAEGGYLEVHIRITVAIDEDLGNSNGLTYCYPTAPAGKNSKASQASKAALRGVCSPHHELLPWPTVLHSIKI